MVTKTQPISIYNIYLLHEVIMNFEEILVQFLEAFNPIC